MLAQNMLSSSMADTLIIRVVLPSLSSSTTTSLVKPAGARNTHQRELKGVRSMCGCR
jgi:hypothetical protein